MSHCSQLSRSVTIVKVEALLFFALCQLPRITPFFPLVPQVRLSRGYISYRERVDPGLRTLSADSESCLWSRQPGVSWQPRGSSGELAML